MAPVTVTMRSSEYGIDLIYYYIHYLQAKGHTLTTRIYKKELVKKGMFGVDIWKTWNIEPVWENVQILMRNFFSVYRQCLEQNLPAIAHILHILPDRSTTIAIVLELDSHSWEHYLTIYFLRPIEHDTGNTIFFRHDDPKLPIDKKSVHEGNRRCMLHEHEYFIYGWQTQDLNFMFHQTPTYELLREWLIPRIGKYLREMEQRKQ